MSTASATVVDPSQSIDNNSTHVDDQSSPPLNKRHEGSATRCSEVLRHVFPRRPSSHSKGIRNRISKTDHYGPLYTRQLRLTGTFYRVIHSFFGNASGQMVNSGSPRAESRASSLGSRKGSSADDSFPSLELVSPGVFLFSGPSLHSAGSHNNLNSRLSNLTGSYRDAHTPHRVSSDSFSMIDTSIDDQLPEPYQSKGPVRSMSDALLGLTPRIEGIEGPLFEDPDGKTTLICPDATRIGTPHNKASWPYSLTSAKLFFQNDVAIARIVQHLDTVSRAQLRSTCRFWYNTVGPITFVPKNPASGRLPTELISGIFSYLRPKDFNSSRRTCRSWMMASLNKNLLSTMLHRGGWSSSIEMEDNRHAQRFSNITSSDEWRLSQCLSRQCAMAAHWTGNGLDDRPAIVESTQINFSELANGHVIQNGRISGTLIFTSSACGQYLLVAKETLIYIYNLGDGLVEPVTSVVCPRRVIAVSMNVSAGRYAIATILEDRMGMVCELHHVRPSPKAGPDGTLGEDSGSPSRGLFNAIELKTSNQSLNLRSTDEARSRDRYWINVTWNLHLRGPIRNLDNSSIAQPMEAIPIERGTSTFYRQLCSNNDPPRTVSICPQRQCVAFGCSAGIDLQWVDAVTGESLSKWFPLTSPSDHLYFLPPRSGLESAKKLRLISSAAHPRNRPAIGRRFFSNTDVNSIWGAFNYEARSQRSQSPDHYNAVPLSDGYHVIFVDPDTDRLTVGCDAPVGGPAKLVRKVALIPPRDSAIPKLYTAAADMSSGARIVAVFGDIIMLYSVPPDVLALSRLEHTIDSQSVYKTAPFCSKGRHPDHWLNWWDEPPTPDPAQMPGFESDRPIWPILLSGTELGRLADVCELAAQTRPEMIVWAFTDTLQCRSWRLHNYAEPVVRSKQYVDRNGLVHETCSIDDESSDVITRDEPSSFVNLGPHNVNEQCGGQSERSVMTGFDGHASGVLTRMPRALAVEDERSADSFHVAGCIDAWYEENGDVVILREK